MITTPASALRLRMTLAGVAVVLLGACRVGTDLPVEEPDELQLAEAEAIARALVLVTVENTVFSEEQVLFFHAHGPLGSHTHPVGGPYVHELTIGGPLPSSHNLFTADLTFDVPCGGGGSLLLEAAAVGEGNPLTQPGFVDYQLGHDPMECIVVVAETNEELILSSPPYVIGETSVRYDGSALGEISGYLEGGVRWDGEAKAGECQLRLDFEAAAESVTAIEQIPVTGTVCDFEIDAVVFR